jgi:hypothetical protein
VAQPGDVMARVGPGIELIQRGDTAPVRAPYASASPASVHLNAGAGEMGAAQEQLRPAAAAPVEPADDGYGRKIREGRPGLAERLAAGRGLLLLGRRA